MKTNLRRAPKAAALVLAMASALACGAAAQSLGSSAVSGLDAMSANAWQPSLLTAFGTFTYADTGLPSPFSRYLEDGLKEAIPKSSHLRLFNRSVAAAMDPAFRAAYGDFFKSNNVDALLSGRYYLEGSSVRARLELTGLSDGVLMGTADLKLPRSSLPEDCAVDPTAAASATASSLSGIAADSGKGGLRVSASTERGAGAVYREGERMTVMVKVSKPAYIKVFHIDAVGVIRLILPNKFSPGQRLVQPGSIVRIPGDADPFGFDMTPPFGTEFIKVVASTIPFADDENLNAKGEAFAELGTDLRGTLTRGIRVSVDSSKAERAESTASYVITRR